MEAGGLPSGLPIKRGWPARPLCPSPPTLSHRVPRLFPKQTPKNLLGETQFAWESQAKVSLGKGTARYFWSFLEKLCSKPESSIITSGAAQRGGTIEAARKIHEYRELHRDHYVDFLPAIASASGRQSGGGSSAEAAGSDFSVYCTVPQRCFLFFFFNTLKSKTGFMVARAGALRINNNIDGAAGRPLPTKKRWRTSSKACAPHLLHPCARRAPTSTSHRRLPVM